MREYVKNKKSALINSIVLTILLVGMVSCRNSSKSVAANKRQSKKETQTTPKPEPANKKIDKAIETAKSYTGTVYKYGGSSRNGIDCSGLIYNSFKTIDIELPRTASEQSKQGKPVSLKELKRGDLVFFTDKKGHTKITHVGLVTQSKGEKNIKFIHSSTKLGVVENDLYAEYYFSIFIKAVRIF